MGGYKDLVVYNLAVGLFDLGSKFCELYIAKTTRTFDQIIQALRSGKQNVVEASLEKSLMSNIKLTGVARASFGEFKEDLLDFLRLRNLSLWAKNDPRVLEIRQIRITNLSNLTNLTNSSDWSNWTNSPEEFANLLITLTSMETYLLDQLIRSLEKQFVEKGGYRENLNKERLWARKNENVNRRQKEDDWLAKIQKGLTAGKTVDEATEEAGQLD